MLEAFVSGFLQLFTWPTFGFVLIGVAAGYVLGLLPGLGGVAGFTLMFPFTFTMEPIAAYAMLLAVSTVGNTTGDITAILFGVPGDPASAALVVDGHAMAKKGEAGRALSANLIASLVGAIIGAFALLAAIPVVRPLVLSFGSPEFFMMTVVGLAFVSTLSSGAPFKGIIIALLGVLLALVGVNAQTGIPRYTFGEVRLWDGISLAAAAIGLFAIPELYELSLKGTSIAGRRYTKLTGIWQGIKDVRIHIWLVIRCSLIGTWFGILPGLGGSVAQWVAYGHAVQSSPDKERFGKGAVEGALGPGAGNNSGLGGALIPTVAFGVPGTVGTALLLGAFLVHGITPGRQMLTVHLDLTMSFVWVIVISNVIAVAISMLFIQQIVRITFVPAVLLIPVITVFVYVGSFASRNVMLDIGVTLAFGQLGVILVALGWPRPPLILGLVLGGIAENYVFISYTRYGAGFLTHPIVLILISITLAVLFYPIIERNLRRTKTDEPKKNGGRLNRATRTPPDDGRQFPAWLNGDVLLTACIGLVGLAAFWAAADWPVGARFMPWVVTLPLIGLSTVYLSLQLAGMANKARAHADISWQVGLDRPSLIKRSVLFSGWMVGSATVIWLVGIYSTPALVLAYLKLVGRQRWPMSLALAAGTGVSMWVLGSVMHLSLPRGALDRLIGFY